MKSVPWQNSYKINIPTIDAQHKQLFLTFAELNEAVKEGLKPSTVQSTLDRLQQYITRHFAVEEKRMRETSYPGYNDQCKAHEEFRNIYSHIVDTFKHEGLTPEIVKTIQNELAQWLKKHVLEMDMDFGRYYNSQ